MLTQLAPLLVLTSAFSNGANWRGKKALVLGTGSSGHDIAQDLHANGVETTLIQRGPTMVLSINPSAKLTYSIYDGVPLEDGMERGHGHDGHEGGAPRRHAVLEAQRAEHVEAGHDVQPEQRDQRHERRLP